MTASVTRRTLPIRRWMALALVSILVIPFLATGIFVVVTIGEPQSGSEAIAAAERRLREDVARWDDPAWQRATRSELAARDVAFLLQEGGREIYRSTADPFAATAGDDQPRIVQQLSIPGTEPPRSAYIVTRSDFGPPEEIRTWAVPLTFFTSLLITLGGIAWFVGRTVLLPLAATSRAAERVAAGNLDVELPTSRVREVADLSTAFTAMSAALRTSLRHQAELEQERRLFIGAVAHDLRTPLFSLRGYLEGLQQGLADTPDKAARYIAVAQEKAAALERLIADLFDYTRLEYLDQAPNRQPLDLGTLLQRLADGLRPQAEAKGVSVSIPSQPAPCLVDGDSHLMTRAVENLLDNAIRHTPSGGRVEVACHDDSDQVIFSVSDTGPGIPVRDLPHLFSPLYRGETSRNRRTGGAGLGLTIARRILLAHGGDLTAGNNPTGGAVFTGSLPHPAPPHINRQPS